MRRVGQVRRRDTSEKPIVQALRALGARVWSISGKGAPDLLVLYRGAYTPLEVKTRRAEGGKDMATKAQADIPWPIVRDVDQALSHFVRVKR